MTDASYDQPGVWRKVSALYHRFLCIILAISILILIVPVTLQVFARFLPFLPHWIWTEEMARLLFVWTIMIGAIVGVRESKHFEVDMWPLLSAKPNAALRLVARAGISIIAFVFLWMGVEFTEFAWYRISELAELPLWIIHIAWPIAGLSWLLFLGEQAYDDIRILSGKSA
ncbi:TRAP transporter small permease [Microvirga sp. BSC39]|uniref:TRAP transporter small permease n=1 Tax=Microvirga sp. BSC39 TaxID=1549810 RepID=UPI0004E90D68|nr:TRAP transporter small permease [Microvirga sp. BSC39]KFG69864.1 C4-dicarboxylate ABC transporter substrate-binding protein [Microvirga sp. BSC39]